jgi:ElaB/YqjD/DUF883 family membrane-anchored ribosome-binding protein
MTTHDRALKQRSKALAQDAVSEILTRANEVGDRTMTAVGHGLEDIARKFEPTETSVDAPSGKVAQGLHSAARYLEQRDPKSALQDLDSAIQAHPYRAIGICLGLGWLIGRAARK